MKTLRLLNTSEHYTEQALRKVLEGTRFRVFAQLPLNKVIQLEKGESLPRGEKTLLANSELDFIIYDENSEPQFAIEFDGVAHQYEEQKQRDVRKNRICQRAGLPLLRVNDNFLEEHDKITMLEFIVGRFVSWDREKDELIKEMYENLSQLTDDELAQATEGSILDPSLDPGVIFDLNHPFPALDDVAKRLFEHYGIITTQLPSDVLKGELVSKAKWKLIELRMGQELSDKFTFSKECELIKLLDENREGKTESIHKFEVRFSIQWILPLVNDYTSEETYFEYRSRTGHKPYTFQDIPGTSMPEVAEHMCDYLTLREIELWAKENLSVLKDK